MTTSETVRVAAHEATANEMGGRFVVTTDEGAVYEVTRHGFAVSLRTGSVVRFVKTGRKVQREQVRVRVEFARDLGDEAGTLEFGVAGHVGGWARPEVC